VWKYVLWPLGAAFLGLARLKALLYRRLLRRIRLPRPTISVGNLTFGGTGKTPVTIWLARELQAAGVRPSVLLRGYGRATAGARLATSDSDPADVGEEAVLLARSLPGVVVAVGERREEAAALAPEAGVFVLDDAFQHLRLERDLDILVVDASRPGDLHAPPVGRLREPLSAASRAHWVLVTRGPKEALPKGLLAPASRALGVGLSWGDEPGPPGVFTTWSELAGKPLVAFAGIGNPEFFFRQAREHGLALAESVAWPDHALPTRGRIGELQAAVSRSAAVAVLCTAKDAVKWKALWRGSVPLVYPELRVDPEDPVAAFRQDLLERAGAQR